MNLQLKQLKLIRKALDNLDFEWHLRRIKYGHNNSLDLLVSKEEKNLIDCTLIKIKQEIYIKEQCSDEPPQSNPKKISAYYNRDIVQS
jgi:hypothetical protein